MRAARLIPRVWDLPQCGAQRENNYANDEPDTDRRCKRRSKYEIDGRCLCETHAKVAALRILLESSDAAKVETGAAGDRARP
jgi:hypothetical protein